jgi:hypothetical protein
MTRKDFELIASTLSRWKVKKDIYSPAYIMWSNLCRDFAEEMKISNSRFNVEKFLRACGVEQ